MRARVQGQSWIAGALALCAGMLLQGCATGSGQQIGEVAKMVDDKGFYVDGALSADEVKLAYLDMMARFNYPIPDILKTDEFWVCDFDQGDIMALGMGGIFWINEKGEYKNAGAGKYAGKYKDDTELLRGQVGMQQTVNLLLVIQALQAMFAQIFPGGA